MTMVDELFPRKTMEQMLENFTPGTGSSLASAAKGGCPAISAIG